MDILEIPELLEIGDPAPDDANPSAIADYLVTMLFQREPAMLHAEFQDGDGRWFVRSAQKDECVASTKNLSIFRAVLARFGSHSMDTQVYGGHTRRVIAQQPWKFVCRFFMSNDNATGFWIRVYAHALA